MIERAVVVLSQTTLDFERENWEKRTAEKHKKEAKDLLKEKTPTAIEEVI